MKINFFLAAFVFCPSFAADPPKIPPPGGLINVSSLVSVGTLNPTVGFVVKEPATFLIRAVGPGLKKFGVKDALEDPFITLVGNGVAIDSNDDWEKGTLPRPIIRFYEKQTGAFTLDRGSLDSVLVRGLVPGSYTVLVQASEKQPGTGTVLVEVYKLP